MFFSLTAFADIKLEIKIFKDYNQNNVRQKEMILWSVKYADGKHLMPKIWRSY